jgi:hypothetical protein
LEGIFYTSAGERHSKNQRHINGDISKTIFENAKESEAGAKAFCCEWNSQEI